MMNRRKKVIWENFVKRRFKPSDREAASKTLTDKCAYAAAALTAIPIPATEVLGVMPLHVGMVTALGHIHDKDISADSASKLVLRIAATVGLSLVGSRVATTAAKVIMPGFGGIVAAPFMFASTKALGAVAQAYFERADELSADDIKSVYEAASKKAKREFDTSRSKSEEAFVMARDVAEQRTTSPGAQDSPRAASERLSELKDMLGQGLIDSDEFSDTKKRILAEL